MDQTTYGFRNYLLPTGDCQAVVDLDIINAWHPESIPYSCFLFADELCESRLPLYVPRRFRVGILKESPNHIKKINTAYLRRHFPLVLSHLRSHIELGPPFRLLPYSSNFLGVRPYCQTPRLPSVGRKQKLCSFVGNLNHDVSFPGYRLRRDVYHVVQGDLRVSCYGRSLRPVEGKIEALEPFAFSIAMENSREDFYFTEKLIDCILAGTIPLYWGCPSIAKFFDPRGILSFSCISELRKLIDQLSIEEYRRLRPYVELNFHRALSERVADFHGYLHRASKDILSLDLANDECTHLLQYRPFDKLAARLRKWI